MGWMGTMLLTTGGALFSAQIGVFSGARAGAKELRQLPDPEKFARLMQDIQYR